MVEGGFYDNEGLHALSREVLRLRPDSPVTINVITGMLVNLDRDAALRAEKLVDHACELTYYRQANFVSTLAAIQITAGHIKGGRFRKNRLRTDGSNERRKSSSKKPDVFGAVPSTSADALMKRYILQHITGLLGGLGSIIYLAGVFTPV